MSQSSSCAEPLPCLTSGSVRLREVRVEDATALTELFKDQDVSQFLSPPPATVEEFTTWIELSRSRHLEDRAACFTVFTGDDEVSGLFMCVRASRTEPSAEIGFALARKLWGSGVFRTAADLYISFLRDRWHIPTLKGRTLARNHRGLGAMRKLGATIVEQQTNKGEAEFVWELRISDLGSQISE